MIKYGAQTERMACLLKARFLGSWGVCGVEGWPPLGGVGEGGGDLLRRDRLASFPPRSSSRDRLPSFSLARSLSLSLLLRSRSRSLSRLRSRLGPPSLSRSLTRSPFRSLPLSFLQNPRSWCHGNEDPGCARSPRSSHLLPTWALIIHALRIGYCM